MKYVKLLLLFLVTSIVFTSCTVIDEDSINDSVSLQELISSYDLWYVDYHRTEGSGDVPFISKAFTLSFWNGTMYANNNIVDIGHTGNGLGITVGSYNAFNSVLEMNHNLDGRYDFEVVQLSDNEIRIDYLSQNVSYYLEGYQTSNFDYDMLFYENIEYFLQEYVAWERTNVQGGTPNVFEEEHFLQFTPENNATFYSSKDLLGTDINQINWDFVGSYEVADIAGHENLKNLTLNYDVEDTETFELSVINDETISLYHINSETTYTFLGKGFIQYLKESKKEKKQIVRNNGRKRTKIKRKTIKRIKRILQ